MIYAVVFRTDEEYFPVGVYVSKPQAQAFCDAGNAHLLERDRRDGLGFNVLDLHFLPYVYKDWTAKDFAEAVESAEPSYIYDWLGVPDDEPEGVIFSSQTLQEYMKKLSDERYGDDGAIFKPSKWGLKKYEETD